MDTGLLEILFALRYVHFLAGITWIGVLYYFNFIQTPFFATELGGTARSAMMRGLVPNALWWFRWGALFTVLTGWAYMSINASQGLYSRPALTLILTGGLMGTLMGFNVWFVIWPIQRRAIASSLAVEAGSPPDPVVAQKAPIAARASRTNTLFSFPMLFFMASASHGQFLTASGTGSYGLYWAIAFAGMALIEANIWVGPAATQKMLNSIPAVIHLGLLVAVVFGGAAFALLR